MRPVLRTILGILFAGLFVSGGATAQGSRPCEERLAEFRTYAELLATSRARTELEAAQTVAALRRENEALRRQVGVLTEALKSAPPGNKERAK